MNTCIISPKAAQDLSDLHGLIARTSPRGADRYIAGIQKKLDLLTTFPAMGVLCEEVAPGLRAFSAGKHVLFYRTTDQGIEVVRVLRGKRDWKKAFEEEGT